MVYNVGLICAAASSSSRAAAMTSLRLSIACRLPQASRSFSAISSRDTLQSISQLRQRPSQPTSILGAQQARSLFQPGFQPSIFSMLPVRPRTFSSTPLNRTQPTSASASSTPPPPSSPPKRPLSEDILTIPNLLTMLRLALTPYIGYLVATHNFVPACTLLFIASITDLLDGWIARKTGKYTVFGSIADPAADKALVTTMVISLALSGMLPWTVATIILGRDVALVISAFVIRYRTLEEPKTWSRYFNPKLPSATVTPTTISKYNTFLQLLLLGLLTLYPILFPNQPSPGLSFSTPTSSTTTSEATVPAPEVVEETRQTLTEKGLLSVQTKSWVDNAITTLMWITAATTVWSGVGYLGGAGTGKVLAARASSKVRQTLNAKRGPTTPK